MMSFMKKGMNVRISRVTLLSILLMSFLIFNIKGAVTGNGGVVSSIGDFRSALGNAVQINGNVVTLTDDVNLQKTLEIRTNVIWNLNGRTVSLHVYNRKAEAVIISSGDVVIKGNGTIKAHAQYRFGGVRAYDAISLSYNGGNLSIYGVTFIADPFDLATAYTLDPNNGKKVSDMIPFGCYITGGSLSDYESTGYPGNSDNTITTVVDITDYHITYNPNGGTMASTTDTYTVLNVNNFQLPGEGAISKKGYSFKGWSENGRNVDNAYLKDKINTSGRVSSVQMNFTAQWEAINYKITYYSNGRPIEAGNNPETYKIGQSTELNKLSNPNADFIGWRDRETGQMITHLPGDDPRNLELEAVWDKKYTITFETGTDEQIDPIHTKTSTEVSLPASLKREGYDFTGWSDGEIVFIGKIPANTYESDITLIAQWRIIPYTITFKDGEEVKYIKSYNIESGYQDFSPIRKDGYVFKNWLDEHSQPITSISKGSSGDRTVSAQWEEIEYRLTYAYNDNSTPDKTISYLYSKAADHQLESASRKGYNFLGWYLADQKLEKMPTPLSDTQTLFELTAQAKWEVQTYKVAFYLNDGTGAQLSENEYTYSIEMGIPADQMPKSPERTGYTFKGWYDNEQGTGNVWKEVPAGTSDLALYAKWEEKTYRIVYIWQGGEVLEDAPKSFKYTEETKLPTKDVMKKSHHTFAGWTKQLNSITYIESIPSFTEGNQLFYAQWSPKVYQIQYHVNGGTEVTQQSYTYGEDLKTRVSHKAGYALTWCYDEALTKPMGDRITPDKIPAEVGDVLSLYAKWTSIEYTIKYDTYYGESIPDGKYTIEQEVVLPTQVNRPGFTFAGWYADEMLTQKIEKIEKGSYGDKTVYATWERGYQLLVAQPVNGQIKVTRKGETVTAGEMIGAGESLIVTATATTSGYALKKLTIGGVDYTTSPQTVTMPKKDLLISAEFSTSTLAPVSAPTINTDPEETDQVMYGTKVKVSIHKTDESSSLYYALNDEMARPYQGEFLVDGKQSDTIVVRAYARKEGYSDGIATREIVFDGRVAINFDLPRGIKAINPGGGHVESAIIKGHTFKFRLEIDKAYFESLDSLKVWGNEELIVPGPTGIFSLDDVMKDVTIKVTGLKCKEYEVSLLPSDNGSLHFTEAEGETTKKVAYGNEISIEAVADLDYKFVTWSDGNQMNPRMLLVTKDTALSAKFIPDYKAFAMILPEIEGVKVKPFSGYTTEVRKGDTFKFYLSIEKGYHEENVVVKANGVVLEKNKGGYAIYKVDKNTRISVEGIVKDYYALKLSDHVTAIDLKSLKDATTQKLYQHDRVLLQAIPADGKAFVKWNDGKADNPRVVTAIDAAQLIPLFETTKQKSEVTVSLKHSVGAAIALMGASVDQVHKGDDLQLKVVLLPAYSKSKVVLKVNGHAVEPDATLRSSANLHTLIYTLANLQEDIEVELEGVSLNVYQIKTVQVDGGVISTSATSAKHGEKIRLTATPAAGNLFVRWWNGNTVEPYEYEVTEDTEVKASFMGATSLVSNEEMMSESVRIYVSGSLLHVEAAKSAFLQIWDLKGVLVKRHFIEEELYSCPLAAGIYLVQVGDHKAVKVFVR